MSSGAQVGRFIVRNLNPWEGPGLFAITGDKITTQYLGFKVHDSVEDATKLIRTYAANTFGRFQAICSEEAPADILGVLGFEVQGHQATIMIMFRRDKKARGAGREFSTPFIEWVFTHPKIWRMWAYVHVDNIPGQRVTERCGALREGLLRRFAIFPNISDEPQDVYTYAIVR